MNLFQLVRELAMDIENTGISNHDTQQDNSLKLTGFYNSKANLKALFTRYDLDKSF